MTTTIFGENANYKRHPREMDLSGYDFSWKWWHLFYDPHERTIAEELRRLSQLRRGEKFDFDRADAWQERARRKSRIQPIDLRASGLIWIFLAAAIIYVAAYFINKFPWLLPM